jgi:Helix-turn-helix domain
VPEIFMSGHFRRSKGPFDWPTLKPGLTMVGHEHRRGGSVAETVKKGARITGADRAKLAGELTKKYSNGASIRAPAEETGRSYGFVHRILTENDVSLRSRGGATRGKSKQR